MTETITLAAGSARLMLVPGLGGGVAGYWTEEAAGRRMDWLRPASAEGLASGSLLALASFPLVPFSNRIREGRFSFGGKDIRLRLNFLPQRHTIHGNGWEHPWRVASEGPDHAVLEFDWTPGDWPFPYRGRQRFELAADRMSITTEVENTGREAMPAGIGQHPYLPRTPQTRLTAEVTGMWRGDDEVMPLDHASPAPAPYDIQAGLLPDRVAMDTCFTGFSGRALVEWPERRARMAIESDAVLPFLVVYTPPGQDHMCVEPVSHMIDAFNLAAAGRTDTGMRVLAPGERLSGTMVFKPALL
jgi:aldose 1-epimerase